MPRRPVAVLGECVADAFADSSAGHRPGELALRVLPGGGPANTAVALARLGTPTRFLGRISADPFGALFRQHLRGSGVGLDACVNAAEPSTLAIATFDPQGQAHYSFHAEGTADWAWTAGELAALPLADVDCLHTGSLALVREPGGPRIEELIEELPGRAGGRPTVSVDPNVRPLLVAPAVYRARLPRWCAAADVLRLSADDLGLLLPGVSPEDACDTWHRAGVPLVVITLGDRGALASLDGRRLAVPAPPTTVVDTIGAGDSFTGGLLHHLGQLGRLGSGLDRLTLDEVGEACRFAARVAALTCSVAGPNPPWPADLQAAEPQAAELHENGRPGPA
ncbi:carbohydrate kinase [Kitasatospora sp. NPDC047058]|uniref:carbohydrate kinase family protein n=1 Tax=Kitasatospora sp. NPDC047058 TaxID=3155620 RepID=UPI0033FDC540